VARELIMNKKLLLSTGLILMMGLTTLPSTTGKAVKLEYFMTEYADPNAEIPPPEKVWIADDYQFIEGFVTKHTLDGYIEGEYIFGVSQGYLRLKIDLSTGEIFIHGNSYLEFQWGDLFGSFYGVAPRAGINSEGVWGSFVLHGSGDFEGMLMKGNFATSSVPGANDLWGTIIIPN
jgi:hypothetical protein